MAKSSLSLKRLKLEPYLPGINEVMKQPGVASLIAAQGERAAARCNAMAREYRGTGEEPVYGSEQVTKRYVAAAVVYAANRAAGLDNLKNNTLKKGCGV